MAGWFYVVEGGAVGPLSRIELEANVRAGRVTPDTLVCEDGDAEWRLARRVPGLVPPKLMKAWQASVAAAARVEPPPPPPRVAAAPKQPHAPSTVAAPAASQAPRAPEAGGRSTSGVQARHVVLIGAVALAAALGGVVGAVLVLKGVRPAAPDAPPAAAAVVPMTPPAAPVVVPEGPVRKLRPELPAAPPPLPPAAQAAVDARLGPLRDDLRSHAAATDAFIASGGLDASTLANRDVIAARLTALADLRARNEALRRELSALPDAVRADCLAAGLPAEMADAAARRAKADVAADVRAREADAEMHDVAGEVLGLLDETFGAWAVRKPEKQVEFGSAAGPEAPRRYAELVADAKDIASR